MLTSSVNGIGYSLALPTDSHSSRILMAITVKTDFVSGISNHGALVWEGFETVTRNEPSCFHVVLLEEFEKTTHAYGPGKESFGDQTTS